MANKKRYGCGRRPPDSDPVTQNRAWGNKTVNIVCGCPNRCRYRYAKAAAKCRGRISDSREWGTTYLQLGAMRVDKGWKYYGTVRFPTTHDITPEFLGECITVSRAMRLVVVAT